MKATFLLFLLALIIFPFYVFPSGVPQPSHMLFFLSGLSAILLFKQRDKVLYDKCVNALLLFVGYVLIVNVANAFLFSMSVPRVADTTSKVLAISANNEPLTYALFYIFNYIIFVGLICIAGYFALRRQLNYFWSAIFFALIICLFIQASIGIAGMGRQFKESFRAILFFNNPNQLGYFSVAASALLFIAHKQTKHNIAYLVFGCVCALYVSSLALSKAAFISVMMFPLIYALAGSGKIGQRMIAMALGALVIFVGIEFVDESVLQNLERRMSGIGSQADDSLEGRAYDRLIRFPQYLLFGAGEGLRSSRFDRGGEIHSLFATLLFSYGAVGATLFLNFLWRLYRRVGIGQMIFLLPIATYNLTHNGWRSPYLWIAFALLMVVAVSKPAKAVRRRVKMSSLTPVV